MGDMPTWTVIFMKWVLFGQMAFGSLLILALLALGAIHFCLLAWTIGKDRAMIWKAVREYRDRRSGEDPEVVDPTWNRHD